MQVQNLLEVVLLAQPAAGAVAVPLVTPEAGVLCAKGTQLTLAVCSRS